MQVAIGTDFLKAFSEVPKGQQKKVREFVESFRDNPTAPGISYEPIQAARDRNLFSARIDQAYRAVVFHPPGTELYVLAWVAHHDHAYAWAATKVFKVNPATGALQVLSMEAVPAPPPTASFQATAGGLFAGVKDKVLLRLGVPEELLVEVRKIRSDEELEASASRFPQEAYEALFLLAAGYPPEQVFLELEKKDEEVRHDPADFAGALANEDTRRRFYVIESAGELTEILNAPLELWRVFLHPKQRRLVTMHANGPVRVLGGAGTGKTVVAMHRAKFLVEEVFKVPGDRILFTTFTRNLATDILSNLRKICVPDVLARIEVVNLDAFVANFLKARGYPHTPVFGDEENEYWDNALNVAPPDLGLSREFLRAEWEQVVQAQNVQDLDVYLRAPRLGRGTRLGREQRAKAWRVFEEYREQLRARGRREFVDLIRDARQLIEHQGVRLPYRAVLVDEAQDMSAEAFRLLRTIVAPGPNDLFIVGDAHQRIYRYRASLGACGIDVRGRGRKLRLNYRTTEEIRRFAVALLEGRPIDDLDDGLDEQKGYLSLTHGATPDVRCLPTLAEEMQIVKTHLETLQHDGAPLESVCLAARTKKALGPFEEFLRKSGIRTYEVRRAAEDRRDQPGLRIATLHRIKGLEFDHMVVVSAREGLIPLDKALEATGDPAEAADVETSERALLYVALTRARKSALVTAHGTVSPFLATR